MGQQLGVLAHAVAGALDLHDDGVVQQAVEQGGGDHRIAEQAAPFREAPVGGQDHGTTLVAGVDQLEQQVSGRSTQGQVADLVDDEQLRAAQVANALA